MVLPVEDLVTWGSQFIWALLRIGGFLMVAPVFGNQLVPGRVKVAMAIAIAIVVAPLLHPMPVITEISVALIADVAIQLFAGIGLGFATVVFFQLFVVAGQFIGMQMGLGFAAMVDPGSGVQVTVWSQFFLLLVTLTFIAMNGHLVLLDVLVAGYKLYPTGFGHSTQEVALKIAELGGWMFVSGVLVALPAVISLLIVNMAFGVMSRSAPQLNVFSLGFPFSLVFGLLIVWVALHGWLPQFERLSREILDITLSWMA
ncbi:MAG: flagellar biosynthetic protein FliR [Gammaproteobacteria bacterium]|nr:MAG: flagellar biosynthetic protein FliR [Gammaproteobacteria bacterium]